MGLLENESKRISDALCGGLRESQTIGLYGVELGEA